MKIWKIVIKKQSNICHTLVVHRIQSSTTLKFLCVDNIIDATKKFVDIFPWIPSNLPPSIAIDEPEHWEPGSFSSVRGRILTFGHPMHENTIVHVHILQKTLFFQDILSLQCESPHHVAKNQDKDLTRTDSGYIICNFFHFSTHTCTISHCFHQQHRSVFASNRFPMCKMQETRKLTSDTGNLAPLLQMYRISLLILVRHSWELHANIQLHGQFTISRVLIATMQFQSVQFQLWQTAITMLSSSHISVWSPVLSNPASSYIAQEKLKRPWHVQTSMMSFQELAMKTTPASGWCSSSIWRDCKILNLPSSSGNISPKFIPDIFCHWAWTIRLIKPNAW